MVCCSSTWRIAAIFLLPAHTSSRGRVGLHGALVGTTRRFGCGTLGFRGSADVKSKFPPPARAAYEPGLNPTNEIGAHQHKPSCTAGLVVPNFDWEKCEKILHLAGDLEPARFHRNDLFFPSISSTVLTITCEIRGRQKECTTGVATDRYGAHDA